MCDFQVTTLPRSGSNMFASALDSHPDIEANGDHYRSNGAGRLKVAQRGNIIDIDIPTIVLTRNALDRARCRIHANTKLHSKEPWNVPVVDEDSINFNIQEGQNAVLLERADKIKTKIFVTYEELTGNKDVRELLEEPARRICAFLGVEYHPLRPVFHKPTIV